MQQYVQSYIYIFLDLKFFYNFNFEKIISTYATIIDMVKII